MWYLSLVYSEGFADYCEAAYYLKMAVNIFEKQKIPAVNDAKKSLNLLEKKCNDNPDKRKQEEELVSAATNGNIETLKKLIKQKVNVNAKVYWKGESALYNAAYTGDINIIKLLVENGADINIKTYKGFTPLMAAIYKSNLNVIKYLLSKHASVNIADYNGETPLMYAVSQNSSQIIELLIASGADINAKDDDGISVLQKANENAAAILRKHGAR